MCIEQRSSEPLEDAVAALFPPQREIAESPIPAPGVGSNRRPRLWDISAAYHCAIVGICLPLGELRRLARRSGVEQWNTGSDYELHHIAVHAARGRNALSESMHRALDARYGAALRRFAPFRTDAELRALWREALGRGEVAAAFWALMSHAHASEAVLDLGSQDVHMLSHQVGAANRADLHRIGELERESAELRQQLERLREQASEKLARRARTIETLEARVASVADLERRLHAAETRADLVTADRLTRAQQALDSERLRAERAEALVQHRSDALAGRDERCARLDAELKAVRAEREASEAALRELLDGLCETQREDVHSCAGLGGRRVLCVGGRTGCVEHYRTLVERARGGFVHHDGGLEHSAKRLHALLCGADAVICVAGNVSHGAYYTVKRFCKKRGTPCVLLENPGLASFLSGIHALTRAGRPETAPAVPP
jgi:hypothetical protein